MLEKHGHAVAEAGTAGSAPGLAGRASGCRRVILLDLMMPVMDGFEFLDALRQAAQWRDIPVLVVTAKAARRRARTAS